MEEKSIYLIKDLAGLSGLSVYTIKYYLKLGLINEVSRSQETNFRYFDDSTVKKLQKVIALRREKVSLKKIAHMLRVDTVGQV
jgi:DNA-binding transcriptional MerR regulator